MPTDYDRKIAEWRAWQEAKRAAEVAARAKESRLEKLRETFYVSSGRACLPDYSRQPVHTLSIEPADHGYVLTGPAADNQSKWFARIRDAVEFAFATLPHETGAILELRDADGATVKAVAWHGDGKPYPPRPAAVFARLCPYSHPQG